MSDVEKVEPALSAEEWAQGFVDWGISYAHRGVTLNKHGGVDVYDDTDSSSVAPNELPSLMALANHALPDSHPLKITRVDVEGLRRNAHLMPVGAYKDGTLTLAAKLAALLPPEG